MRLLREIGGRLIGFRRISTPTIKSASAHLIVLPLPCGCNCNNWWIVSSQQCKLLILASEIRCSKPRLPLVVSLLPKHRYCALRLSSPKPCSNLQYEKRSMVIMYLLANDDRWHSSKFWCLGRNERVRLLTCNIKHQWATYYYASSSEYEGGMNTIYDGIKMILSRQFHMLCVINQTKSIDSKIGVHERSVNQVYASISPLSFSLQSWVCCHAISDIVTVIHLFTMLCNGRTYK